MIKILLILIISVSLMSCKKSINQEYSQNRNRIDYKIKTTHNENKQIKGKENYGDKLEDGKWIAYYENGQIKLKVNYKNRILNGEWIAYYENEQIKYKEIIKRD